MQFGKDRNSPVSEYLTQTPACQGKDFARVVPSEFEIPWMPLSGLYLIAGEVCVARVVERPRVVGLAQVVGSPLGVARILPLDLPRCRAYSSQVEKGRLEGPCCGFHAL